MMDATRVNFDAVLFVEPETPEGRALSDRTHMRIYETDVARIRQTSVVTGLMGNSAYQ